MKRNVIMKSYNLQPTLQERKEIYKPKAQHIFPGLEDVSEAHSIQALCRDSSCSGSCISAILEGPRHRVGNSAAAFEVLMCRTGRY